MLGHSLFFSSWCQAALFLVGAWCAVMQDNYCKTCTLFWLTGNTTIHFNFSGFGFYYFKQTICGQGLWASIVKMCHVHINSIIGELLEGTNSLLGDVWLKITRRTTTSKKNKFLPVMASFRRKAWENK